MLLQILPPDSISITESIFENQLLLVAIGLGITLFTILKVTNFLNKQKTAKNIA
jgi:hypothetical protein